MGNAGTHASGRAYLCRSCITSHGICWDQDLPTVDHLYDLDRDTKFWSSFALFQNRADTLLATYYSNLVCDGSFLHYKQGGVQNHVWSHLRFLPRSSRTRSLCGQRWLSSTAPSRRSRLSWEKRKKREKKTRRGGMREECQIIMLRHMLLG